MASISEMIMILDSTDFGKIYETREQLIQMGAEIVPQLLDNLTSTSVKQLTNLIAILGEIQDQRAIAPLCDLLLNHPSMMIRYKTASILANFTSDIVIDSLAQSLNNATESEMVTMWVVTSLGKIRTHVAYNILVDYLHQNISPTMRYMTIRALGEQQNKQAIEHITPYLEDEDSHVQREAEIALQNLSDKYA